jgi:hypothetical protein
LGTLIGTRKEAKKLCGQWKLSPVPVSAGEESYELLVAQVSVATAVSVNQSSLVSVSALTDRLSGLGVPHHSWSGGEAERNAQLVFEQWKEQT